MNLLTAITRITQDPELRYLQDGSPVLQLNVALNSGYGKSQTTTFLRCSLFGKRAETLHPMLVKGQQIGISGEFRMAKFTAKDGTEKQNAEVRLNELTLIGGKNSQGEASTPPSQNNAATASQNAPDRGYDSMAGLEDDVPFANPYQFTWRVV